jgi:hypothetical protein
MSQLLDDAGRRQSPGSMPGFHSGRPPRNKGALPRGPTNGRGDRHVEVRAVAAAKSARNGARGRTADRHPAPARAQQPRLHLKRSAMPSQPKGGANRDRRRPSGTDGDRVCVAQLMRRKAPLHSGERGGPTQFGACSCARPGSPARGADDDAEEWSDGKLETEGRPRLKLLAAPFVHAGAVRSPSRERTDTRGRHRRRPG